MNEWNIFKPKEKNKQLFRDLSVKYCTENPDFKQNNNLS